MSCCECMHWIRGGEAIRGLCEIERKRVHMDHSCGRFEHKNKCSECRYWVRCDAEKGFCGSDTDSTTRTNQNSSCHSFRRDLPRRTPENIKDSNMITGRCFVCNHWVGKVRIMANYVICADDGSCRLGVKPSPVPGILSCNRFSLSVGKDALIKSNVAEVLNTRPENLEWAPKIEHALQIRLRSNPLEQKSKKKTKMSFIPKLDNGLGECDGCWFWVDDLPDLPAHCDIAETGYQKICCPKIADIKNSRTNAGVKGHRPKT